jgi:UDP:flavonoid glycosyltransferase YjiC (YdhE family)
MQIFMMTLGTRGDLELFLILGRELHQRGHHITLGTSPFYSSRVHDAGLDWAQVGNGTQDELVAILRSQASVSDKRARITAYAQGWIQPQMHTSRRQVEAIIAKTDYIIDNLRTVWKRNGKIVPAASLIYDPPGDLANLAKYATQLVQHHGTILEVVAMNKELVDPHNLWGPQYRFTGFWKHHQQPPGEPPAELQQFLAGGTPPVVVTMGSMVTFDTDKLLEKIIAALRLTEQRGVVVSSWSGIADSGDFPETVCCVDETPYDWLFPQARCVIHHGGCGTVSAVLRAGRPSILLPQITSQENFGNILARENLVTGIFDVDHVKSHELGDAIEAATTKTKFRETAEKWSSRVRRDPGVEAAADWIEQHANEVCPASG